VLLLIARAEKHPKEFSNQITSEEEEKVDDDDDAKDESKQTWRERSKS
jgi:hypothetical protein